MPCLERHRRPRRPFRSKRLWRRSWGHPLAMSQSDMIVELEAWRATQVVFNLKLDGPDVTDNVSRQALRSVGNRKAWVSLVCLEASPSGECRSPMCVNVLDRGMPRSNECVRTGKVSELGNPDRGGRSSERTGLFPKGKANHANERKTRGVRSFSQAEYEYHNPKRDTTHQILSRRHRDSRTDGRKRATRSRARSSQSRSLAKLYLTSRPIQSRTHMATIECQSQ